MTDFEGLPFPENAPAPGACVRVERPEDGLVRIVLDPPHRPKLAVLDTPLLRDFDLVLDGIVAEARTLRGLVVTGRTPLSFAAGADVDTIAAIRDARVAEKVTRAGQAVFQKLFKLGRKGGGRIMTVAAVGGPVPGGACELALACDRIVLAEHEKTRIGLPEVRLGIFPAWGGTQRLPRRIGVARALEVILSGRLYPARPALKLGLVDRVTHPEYLLQVADDVAMRRKKVKRRGQRPVARWLIDRNPIAGAVIASKARQRVLAETKGHYPAPLAALPLVVRAPRTRLAKGLEAEVRGATPLLISDLSKELVNLFLRSERAKKLGELPDGTKPEPFTRGAVVGAGVMGGAIASLMCEQDIATRLRDLDRAQLDAAQRAHEKEISKLVKRRRLARHEGTAAVDRLEVTTEAQGFGRCQIVIEAVAERLGVKRAVLGELAALMPRDAVLATNTSSLSVSEIAAELPDPGRVVGIHFFNPVRRMPLVEIVRGERTDAAVVTRAAALALALGKTPVVTRDVAGFLVNRVLGPYLDEAVRLVAAGGEPEAIDAALVEFGMPMGPCELIDEVGLDICAHVAESLHAAYGERMQPSTYLRPLVVARDLGKKTGAGLYLWREQGQGRVQRAGRNPRATPGPIGFTLTSLQVVDRLVLALANEAARCIEEEVVASAADLDLAVVFGTGFAPFRGGVLRYVDERGLAGVVERLRLIRAASDLGGERLARYEPSALLVRLAESGRRFHGS